MHKGHEVIVVKNDKLTLRHDPVMLQRRGHRDIPVFRAVDDEHRATIALQHASQRALIGIVEVSRIRQCEGSVGKEAKMRESIPKHPQGSELGAVEKVVLAVASREFVFLDADGRKHHDGGYALRNPIGHAQNHASAHAESQELGLVYIQRVEQLDEINSMSFK